MPRPLGESVSIRDLASQLTLCIWSIYRSIPAQNPSVNEIDCQKTAVEVGGYAAELGPQTLLSCATKVICNDFLESATIISVCFGFDGRARTSAHPSRRLAYHER